MSLVLMAKQAKLVKALFECMPAFPLSHTCIVTDKLQQIPLWVGEVESPSPCPLPAGEGGVVPTKSCHKLGEGVY